MRRAVLAARSAQQENSVGRPFLPDTLFEHAHRPLGLSAHKEIPRMPDAISDRRVAPRSPLILLAEVTDLLSSVKFPARTSDLSRTGCYIDMLSPLPRGTEVHVLLKNGEEVFESAAIVMYVSPGLGIGVQFAELPAERQSLLDRWLAVAAKTGG
jgi:hypothetical protein